MHLSSRFSLSKPNQQKVSAAWFEAQQNRWPNKSPVLRDFLVNEVEALKAFHDNNTNADEAAQAITRPISCSSVPSLGTYSDESVAIADFWTIFISALVEWPSARTADLYALLDAIGKVPDRIHNGEALDDDGKTQLSWGMYPYFGMALHDANLAEPGQIYKESPNAASLDSARLIYLKLKDIEAQAVAKHILPLNKVKMKYIIRALEKHIDSVDTRDAPDQAVAFKQIKLDFHIPAISSWFRYNGLEIYRQVVQDGLKDWTERDMPDEARKFEDGTQRWSFWKERLSEMTKKNEDETVRVAAEATLKYMDSAATDQ